MSAGTGAPAVPRTETSRRPATPRRVRGKPNRQRLRSRLLLRLVVVVLLVIEVVPLLWLILSSLKTEAEFSSRPVWALPKGLNWQNYSDAWTTGHLGTYLRNSVIATFPALALIIVLSVAAGFALEVMKWRGRGFVLLIFLTGFMVPAQMILLPLFTIYYKAHLINNLLSLIITYTAYGLPLSVFMMATFYKSVPREMLEAAAIDGANIYRSFWHISLPMVRNAILTIALVQFFFIWNDLLFSLTFISQDNRRTVQTGLLNFVGQFGQTSWGPTFASICITVFPTLAVYLVLNQRIMKGLTVGSVKG
jgi:raffinose/stachyose/melibiose transport system permease protein